MNKTFSILLYVLSVTTGLWVNNSGTVEAETQTKQGSPEAVATQFLDFHFSHDMGFTEDAVKQRSKWFTPDLTEATRSYFAIPQNPDEPPYINGDPFTGTQEYPDRFSSGAVKMETGTARVNVTFHWKEGPSRSAVVVLKETNGNWLIDDIEFPDQESLRKTLKMEEEPC